jgi:HEAT repeat protein
MRSALAAAALLTSVLPGCAVSEKDVHRWETTERGPDKLVAVLTHDKYAYPLRTEAALSLVRMKPRGGKRVGLDAVVPALASLGEEPRKKIVAGMTPELVKQIGQPAPARNADGTIPPDPSIPYKDAAFALLSHEPPLVTDEDKNALSAVLIAWVQTNFEERIENTAQGFGVEQMMRFFGAPAVKDLPKYVTEHSTKLDRIAGLVADLGDAPTKQRTSEALVALAKEIDSAAWRDKQTGLVAEANRKAGNKVSDEQLKRQVLAFQDQELTKVFSAMKRVGGRPVIDYCLGYAGQRDASEDRRKAALAALEGRVDKTAKADIDKLYAIARDDATPDAVRDLAFNRLGELPKEQVLPKLYALFETKKWKVRWVAASLALRTLKTNELGEFLRRLPDAKLGMSEPITYGGLIQKMEGDPKPRQAIEPFLRSKDVPSRLVALGFFYGGKKSDVGVVQPFESDTAPVPKCDPADECGWVCAVPKAPGSQEVEEKTIGTVGDFVKLCVVPSMTNP